MFGTVRQDLRYAGRTLAATPLFSAVAALSLALGIGANAALFSVVDAVLLRPLPVKNPDELVEFIRAHPDGAMMTNLPQGIFEHFQRDPRVLTAVFAVSPAGAIFRADGAPERIRTHQVSGSFFPAMGVPSLIGRSIGPDDDRPGAAKRVAVLSHGFWRRKFGRDPAALGATVRVDGEPFTVVGVMPPEFFGTNRGAVPDLWLPFAIETRSRQAWVMGRLRRGVTVERARAELEPVFRRALETDGNSAQWQRSTERERNAFLAQRLLVRRATAGSTGVRWTYWDYYPTLKIALGLTALVLLIACMNLANLLMARSAARSREIGIRLALGAGPWRVARQLITENLLLAFAGGALGLVLAYWGHAALLGFLAPDPQTVALGFAVDHRLLGFGLALTVATGLLFGLLPAARAARAGVAVSMRGISNRSGALSMPLAKGLLAAQICLSMVLLVSAGLFARSLRNLGAADLGIARESLAMSDLRPAGPTPEARRQFWAKAAQRVSEIPGVRGVALAGDAVFGNGGWRQTVWIDRPGERALDGLIADNLVSAGFFATVGIPMVAGREFGDHDRDGSPRVAVVNRTFARRFFGAANPIGRRFGDSGAASSGRYEIVGVVADAKYGSVREQVLPMAFYPLTQYPPRAACVLHVRAAQNSGALAALIRREIQALDGGALVSDLRTITDVLWNQLRQDRMFAALAGFFAALALALGAIGIYGILAYRVARRTPEIGVRIALGAQRRDVLWLVMREILVLLAIGAAMGAPAAVATARLVKGLLFALDPLDPATVAVAGAALFAAGTLAGYLPARRASSIEPLAALRSD